MGIKIKKKKMEKERKNKLLEFNAPKSVQKKK